MSDAPGRLCFSNAPFRWVERVFFSRRLLWPVGAPLATGLFLTLVGLTTDREALVGWGLLLAVPFLLWVTLSVAVSGVLVPRFAVLGRSSGAVYLGRPGVSTRLAAWASKHEESAQPEARPKTRRGSDPDR